MKELEKIRKIISKQLPNKKVSTLLTIDAMLGQNSFDQAKLFKESTAVDGIVLTKMDGTGKGGIVFSITEQLKIPIAYISFGEKSDQLAPFDANEYLSTLLG
jgi:fused signal recognition particle receptor